jgi:hypothetical protein
MPLFKRLFRRRIGGEPSGLQKALFGLLILCLAAGFLVGAWFLSQLGPRDIDFQNFQVDTAISEADRQLQEESRALEARFEEVVTMREPEEEDLELLREALEKQEAYVEAVEGMDASGLERARVLRTRYHTLAAATIFEESLAAEQEAERLAREESHEAAREKYLEAFELQRQINENYPLSGVDNLGRATFLERQSRFLAAEPLLRRSMSLAAEVRPLVEAERWDEAEAKLEEAIRLQDRINREFRGSTQASFSRLEQLRLELVGIQSGDLRTEIQRVVQLADARNVAGQNLEAAALYDEAARLQRELNESYRNSPYASSENIAELRRKSETAESYELGRTIERSDERLRQLLSERRTIEAVKELALLRRSIQQMEEAFPRSSLNDENLQLKAGYLNLVQNDLDFIQDRIYETLLPIPEGDGWHMLETEVSQALYSLIMGSNPSRNPGDVRPVDSVSWVEAKRFCERLSWILGKSVRLPTENEFRLALGPLRYVVLEKHVWSAADSGGEPREVGQKEAFASGFHDLLGNVSEWLESGDRFEAEDARHIGGHAQDRLERIFTVPVRESPRGERNRLTGFRVVVRVGDAE